MKPASEKELYDLQMKEISMRFQAEYFVWGDELYNKKLILYAKKLKQIEDTVKTIYGTFFCFDNCYPCRKVIVNDRASYHGMALTFKRDKKTKNDFGLSVKTTISEIHLKRIVFHRDGFFDALTTYVHEACHMFGGDSSAAFSRSLTIAMELLLRGRDAVDYGAECWELLFAE